MPVPLKISPAMLLISLSNVSRKRREYRRWVMITTTMLKYPEKVISRKPKKLLRFQIYHEEPTSILNLPSLEIQLNLK